jgi:hypothetical protein
MGSLAASPCLSPSLVTIGGSGLPGWAFRGMLSASFCRDLIAFVEQVAREPPTASRGGEWESPDLKPNGVSPLGGVVPCMERLPRGHAVLVLALPLDRRGLREGDQWSEGSRVQSSDFWAFVRVRKRSMSRATFF